MLIGIGQWSGLVRLVRFWPDLRWPVATKVCLQESGSGRRRSDGHWNCPGCCNCRPAGISKTYIWRELVDMFILLNRRSHGYIYSFKWDILHAGGDIWCFRSPADSLQKLLERRPGKVFYCPDMYFLWALYLLRGGLARFTANCPDILYFLSALYLLMRYYRSGNFLSFHSAKRHSVAKVAFKCHVIINATQVLSYGSA